jgi:exoribonuclease II
MKTYLVQSMALENGKTYIHRCVEHEVKDWMKTKELLDHLQEQHELTQNEALDQLHAGMVRMREASVASRVPAVYHETAEEVKSNNNDDDTNKELVKV